MLVKDLMSTSIITVSPDDTLERVIFIMKSEDVGVVPVCDLQNRLVGIITDRDLIIRDGLRAADFMSEAPVTVNTQDDIHNAALKFSQYKVRRLPVLDGERLAGMLSLKDLAKKKILMAEIGHIIYSICN